MEKMSTTTIPKKCFICTIDYHGSGSSRRSTDRSLTLLTDYDSSFVLSHILDLSHLQNYLQSEEPKAQLYCCKLCLDEISNIRELFGTLEILEKEILDRKYEIELKLKGSSREYETDQTFDDFRSQVVRELSCSSMISMLEKIKKKQLGKKYRPNTNSFRVMKSVSIPRIQTLISTSPDLMKTVETNQSNSNKGSLIHPSKVRADIIQTVSQPQKNINSYKKFIEEPSFSSSLENTFSEFDQFNDDDDYLSDDLDDFLEEDTGEEDEDDRLPLPPEFPFNLPDVSVEFESAPCAFRPNHVRDIHNGPLRKDSGADRDGALSDVFMEEVFIPKGHCQEQTNISGQDSHKIMPYTAQANQKNFRQTQMASGSQPGGLKKSFVCGPCGETFESYEQMMDHDLLHLEDAVPPVVTGQSGQRHLEIFTAVESQNNKRRSRKARRRRNSVARNIRANCEYCEKSFSRSDSLKYHVIRVHLKQCQYHCEICHIGCVNLSTLRNHMICHSDERNFKCNLCERAFKVKADLKKHCQTMHCVTLQY